MTIKVGGMRRRHRASHGVHVQSVTGGCACAGVRSGFAALVVIAVVSCSACGSGGDVPRGSTGARAAGQQQGPAATTPARPQARLYRLLPLPTGVQASCRLAQAGSVGVVLCPRRLPRATAAVPPIPMPGQQPPPPRLDRPPALSATILRNDSSADRRLRPIGLDFSYGVPVEPGTAPTWRRLVWRNQPAYFLHVQLFWLPRRREKVPDEARPYRIDDTLGWLLPATGYGRFSASGGDQHFGNHERFLWRAHGRVYLLSVHYFGRGTRELLEEIFRSVAPVRSFLGRDAGSDGPPS